MEYIPYNYFNELHQSMRSSLKRCCFYFPGRVGMGDCYLDLDFLIGTQCKASLKGR